MITKEYQLYGDSEIDFVSFCDEFKIDQSTFDITKLKVNVDYDYSSCYYEGDPPAICVIVKYDK